MSEAYELDELITQLEESERGGWRMNVAIHRIHACQAYSAIESSNFESRHFVDSNAEGFYFGPSYTQSIDAAMSLIPGGWSRLEIVENDQGFSATIEYPSGNTQSKAKTMPLALCAAGLRLQKP